MQTGNILQNVGGGWHASTFWHYASGNLTGQNFCGDLKMVFSLATDIGVLTSTT